MTLPPPTVIFDSREPTNHPWLPHLPAGWKSVVTGLETGDVCLLENPGWVCERKSGSDFLACVGRERQRFDRELARARNLAGFFVIVESDLPALDRIRGGLSMEAILGSVAAWCRRGTPVLFAGDVPNAAALAWRILAQPAEEAAKLAARIERARAGALTEAAG
ncbi:MAG: hypothetical protein ACKV19_14240 [Verrucomicrobiales bacterium]